MTLFGQNDHLGGKLSYTMYPANYTSQVRHRWGGGDAYPANYTSQVSYVMRGGWVYMRCRHHQRGQVWCAHVAGAGGGCWTLAMPLSLFLPPHPQIKMSEMELDVGPGRGYRYYTGPTLFPFGEEGAPWEAGKTPCFA